MKKDRLYLCMVEGDKKIFKLGYTKRTVKDRYGSSVYKHIESCEAKIINDGDLKKPHEEKMLLVAFIKKGYKNQRIVLMENIFN